jgi:Periplasmic binding protein domain
LHQKIAAELFLCISRRFHSEMSRPPCFAATELRHPYVIRQLRGWHGNCERETNPPLPLSALWAVLETSLHSDARLPKSLIQTDLSGEHDMPQITRRGALKTLTVALVTASLSSLATVASAQSKDPIKVGVLHSLSGTMAISETVLKDVALMAIDEINAKGGVMGRKLEPVVVDPASTWPLFAEKARQLISNDKVLPRAIRRRRVVQKRVLHRRCA